MKHSSLNGKAKPSPTGERVCVLDIGSSKIVCLTASGDGHGGMKVIGASITETHGVRKGIVTDLDAVSRSVDTALRRAQQEAGYEISNVIAGVSGTHLEGHSAMGLVPIFPRSRQITRDDVHQVILHSRNLLLPPDRELIQVLPKEFRIDGQRGIKRPVGMSGGRLEVTTYLITGQTTHIQNVERAIQMTGRKIEQMVVQALASGLGVLTDEEIELGAVVVDIGAGKTDVGVFHNGSIVHSMTLPIGAAHVTSDLSTLLRTSPEEAERLKINHGAAMSRLVSDRDSIEVMQLGQTAARPLQRKVLCEIIESRMRELAVLVKQQIEKSGLFGMLPGGVVLTGGGSQLPGTDKLFESVLKHLRVRVAEPDGVGEISGRPGMAAAMGMARFAIQCFEDELAPISGPSSWKDKILSLIPFKR